MRGYLPLLRSPSINAHGISWQCYLSSTLLSFLQERANSQPWNARNTNSRYNTQRPCSGVAASRRRAMPVDFTVLGEVDSVRWRVERGLWIREYMDSGVVTACKWHRSVVVVVTEVITSFTSLHFSICMHACMYTHFRDST